MFCHRFRDQVYRTVQQLAHPEQLELIQKATGIPINRILLTKCGYICKALEVMMNFTNKRNHPLDVPLSSFYGYMFDLEGVSSNDHDTGTDHEFIILYNRGWWIIDAYLGCRELTCRQVDPTMILQVVQSLQTQFNEELWFWLTGCHSTDDQDQPTNHVRAVVTEFDYTRI